MKIYNKIIISVLIFSSILSAQRITKDELYGNADIILTPAFNLSITEECSDTNRKILYPSDITMQYNVVRVANPEYEPLPSTVKVVGNRVVMTDINGVEFEIGKRPEENSMSIVFEKHEISEIPYDYNTKIFKIKSGCKYRIQNEKIYVILKDDVVDKINDTDIVLSALKSEELTLDQEIQILSDEVGLLRIEEARLRSEINEKAVEIAELAEDAIILQEEIDKLYEEIGAIDTSDTNDAELLAEIDALKLDIKQLLSDIKKAEIEINSLKINYTDTMAELTTASAILGAILNVTSEEELIRLMEQVIIPETNEKQRYNVKHLKGDIMPSKLIRVDE